MLYAAEQISKMPVLTKKTPVRIYWPRLLSKDRDPGFHFCSIKTWVSLSL